MLLRQTVLYLPAQIVGPLVQVVAAIVWTHWLTPAPYGLLTFLIASQELVFLVTLSWWTHYTMRYLGGLDGEGRRHFARSETPIYALSFLGQALVTLAILAFLGEPLFGALGASAIAYVGTRSLLMHLGERARAQSRIGVYTIGQATGSVLGFGVALCLVALVSAKPETVLTGFALAQVVGVVMMWRALGLTVGGLLPHERVISAALQYGAPLLVAGGFAWIAQNGIRVVIEKGAGATALGLIAVGWGLGQRLAATLAMLVIAASFPLAVKSVHGGSREEAYRQLSLGGVLLMGLIVPASIGLYFLSEPFVTLFVAAPFREMTIAVLPYAAAAGAIRNIRMHIADPVFLLIERPKINTMINIVDATIMVVGCAIGLWLGGLVGAVVGSLVGTCISTVSGFILARQAAGFVFPSEDALRICIASGVMTLVLLLVPWSSIGGAPLARMTEEALVGAVTYAIAICALYPDIVRGARRRLAEARG